MFLDRASERAHVRIVKVVSDRPLPWKPAEGDIDIAVDGSSGSADDDDMMSGSETMSADVGLLVDSPVAPRGDDEVLAEAPPKYSSSSSSDSSSDTLLGDDMV